MEKKNIYKKYRLGRILKEMKVDIEVEFTIFSRENTYNY